MNRVLWQSCAVLGMTVVAVATPKASAIAFDCPNNEIGQWVYTLRTDTLYGWYDAEGTFHPSTAVRSYETYPNPPEYQCDGIPGIPPWDDPGPPPPPSCESYCTEEGQQCVTQGYDDVCLTNGEPPV